MIHGPEGVVYISATRSERWGKTGRRHQSGEKPGNERVAEAASPKAISYLVSRLQIQKTLSHVHDASYALLVHRR